MRHEQTSARGDDLVWDDVRLHLPKPLREFIAASADRLTVFQLLVYAPGLNPREGIRCLVERGIDDLAAVGLSQAPE